jgi:hypothetical protein
MVRWRGDKRQMTINAAQIAALGQEIYDLAMEAWSILSDIFRWSMKEHLQVNLDDTVS